MKNITVRLGHLCLEVAALKTALRFWTPLLAVSGFNKIMDGQGFVGFSNGTFEVFLCHSKPRRVRRGKPSGKEMIVSDHIALRVDKRADVDAVASAMTKAGVAALFPAEEHRQFAPGYYAVSYSDPDHNVIEVYTVPKHKRHLR
jgi:catechol 2,3-dioxygenase-like lactoylglutathione lyase family enzyme